MSSPDKELIEKLENIAGHTNEDVLSVKEGRSLLSTAQDALAHSTSSSTTQAYQSTLTHPEHIARLSIASSLDKRLPSEILEHIFRSGSEGLGVVKLPPTESDYRWLLGRVCSAWRRLSRSIPIWEAEISVGTSFGAHKHLITGSHEEGLGMRLVGTSFGDKYDAEHVRKQLEYAFDILPEIAFIRLIVHAHTNIPTEILVPYLTHIKALDCRMMFSSGEGMMQALPSGALSRLESLHYQLQSPSRNNMKPFDSLFGESSRLKRLLFSCVDPSFLLSDIPWSQLRSLVLDAVDGRSDKPFGHIWDQLAQRDPFLTMSSLEHLSFNMKPGISHVLLPCKFPWERLKTLRIEWHNERKDLPLIMKPLQSCTSLLTLTIHHRGQDIDVTKVCLKPILLPSLRTLEASRLPLPMVMSISSGALRSLQLDSIALEDFYTIAANCPQLTNYQSCLTDGDFAPIITGFITLPHLSSLHISFDDLSSFPAAITAPLLTSLDVKTSYSGLRLFRTIFDFMVRSKMHLRRFSCILPGSRGSEIVYSLPSELSRELLAIIHGSHEVNIEGITLPQEILDEIASGLFLSHTKQLSISISNLDNAFTVIGRFLERQAATDREVVLRELYGYVPCEAFEQLRDEQHKQLALDLKKLGEKYHVKCIVRCTGHTTCHIDQL